MLRKRAARTTAFAILLATSAAALDLILERELRQCPCRFRVSGFASERAPISVQVIPARVHRDWVESGRPDDIVSRTSNLKPGKWSAEQRVQSKGAWVVLVHSSPAVSAKLTILSTETSCSLKLSFKTQSPKTSRLLRANRNVQLSPMERIINGVRLRGGSSGGYNALIRYGTRLCSGSLVAPRWVLTAAHCGMSAGDAVYAGAPARKLAVAEVVRHPEFARSATRMANDIALVRLRGAAPNARAVAVALNDNAREPRSGSYARATGFGSSADERASDLKLRAIDVRTTSIGECRASFRRAGYVRIPRAFDGGSQMCTDVGACGGAACGGDSGGALSVPRPSDGEAVQVGIHSFSVGRCGSLPEVHTRVAPFVKWIQDTTGGEARVVTL